MCINVCNDVKLSKIKVFVYITHEYVLCIFIMYIYMQVYIDEKWYAYVLNIFIYNKCIYL